jgi:hypothetical protein
MLGLALLASLATAAPARASGGFLCEGESVSLNIATGRLMVLNVLGAYVEAGDRAWSTGPERGEGTPIIVGQAFGDDEQVLVDFTDPNIESILISVRLRFTGEDEDWPLSGTMTAEGTSYAIRCGEG